MNAAKNVNPFIVEYLKWESDFFKKKIGRIVYKRDDISLLQQEQVRQFLDRLIEKEKEKFHLIQIAFDANDYFLFTPSQQSGFEVVEIRSVFRTTIHRHEKVLPQKNLYQLEIASDKDLNSIKALLHRSFTDNPGFFSRFKNEAYFAIDEAKRYYEFCIESAFADNNIKLAVCKDNTSKVVGFMSIIESDNDKHTSLPVLRTGLTAIAREHQGKGVYSSLNSYILSSVEYDNYIHQNITQSYNLAMLKNYNRLQKKFYINEYILYFKKNVKNV